MSLSKPNSNISAHEILTGVALGISYCGCKNSASIRFSEKTAGSIAPNAPTLMPPLGPPGSAGPVLGKHSELQNKKVDSVIIYKHVAASS